MCWVNTRLTEGLGLLPTIKYIVKITLPVKWKATILQTILKVGRNKLGCFAFFFFCLIRQSIWLCRRIHLQYKFSDRHCSFICCWLYFHNVPATHALSWCHRICPNPEERRGASSEAPAPTQREAYEADADGCGASSGALPQPHHSSKGECWGHRHRTVVPVCLSVIMLHFQVLVNIHKVQTWLSIQQWCSRSLA